jgi:hypothetical protein
MLRGLRAVLPAWRRKTPAVSAPQTCQKALGRHGSAWVSRPTTSPGYAPPDARSSAACGVDSRQAGQPGFHDPTAEP